MKKKEKQFTMVAIRPKYQRLLRIEAAKRDMKISELLAEYIMMNNNIENAHCPACGFKNKFIKTKDGFNCSHCGLFFDSIDSEIACNCA